MASHRRDVAPQTGTVDTSGTGGHQDVKEVTPEFDAEVQLANDPARTPNVEEGILTAFDETTRANPEAAASVANPPQPRTGPVAVGGEGFVYEGTGPSRDPETEPRFTQSDEDEDQEDQDRQQQSEEDEDQQRYGYVEDGDEEQQQEQEQPRSQPNDFRMPDARSVVSAGRLQPDEDFTEPGEGEAYEPDQPEDGDSDDSDGDGDGDEDRGDQGPPLTTDEAEPRVDQTGQPGEQAQPSDADQDQDDADSTDDGDQEQQQSQADGGDDTTESDSEPETTEAQGQDYDIPTNSVSALEEWVEEPDDLDQQKARAQAALELENSEEGQGRKTARSFLEAKLAEEPEEPEFEADDDQTGEGDS